VKLWQWSANIDAHTIQ